jgi:hypothetical protein
MLKHLNFHSVHTRGAVVTDRGTRKSSVENEAVLSWSFDRAFLRGHCHAVGG